MKGYLRQYHGVMLALDEGLLEGDAVLADSLWR